MKVAISHPGFMELGGAEVVSANVIKAFGDYDITLITDTDVDKELVEEKFGLTLPSFNVVVPKKVRFLPDNRFEELRYGLIHSYLDEYDDFDITISTKNEAELPSEGFQYVHFPHIVGLWDKSFSLFHSFYIWYFMKYLFPKKEKVESSPVICNSKWTADVFRVFYDVEPKVITPPVRDSFSPKKWSDREEGFVSGGRICLEKRQVFQIKVMDELVSRGKDVHLHICGNPESKASGSYDDKVKGMVKKRDYIEFEGFVSRDRLCRLLETHKYGFHSVRNEHYGIIVAEMLLAGQIPFVYNLGGQKELVKLNDLLYENKSEFVKKFIYVSENEQDIRNKLRFDINTPKQFRDEIKTIVSKGENY